MSGKSRRASIKRFYTGWLEWLFVEKECNAEVVKVDWKRQQITIREMSWIDYEGKLVTFKIPLADIRQHVRDYSFPHQARCIWCDPVTCEPINDYEALKLAQKRSRKLKHNVKKRKE